MRSEEGHRVQNGSVRHRSSSGEDYTVNNDLEPLMLDEVIGNEDALDHKSDILLGVLCALSIVVWDRIVMKIMVLTETEPESPLKWYQAGGCDGL